MSKIVATSVIRGSHDIFKQAASFLDKAIKEKGPNQKIGFPETAFYLPLANALLGARLETLKDALPILEHAKSLLPRVPSEKVWLPYLGDALNAGMSALFCEEIIVALRYLYGEEPQKDCNGFFTDTIMRSLGIQLVDGRMPGFAAILGAAPDNKTAVNIVRELQQRNILIFVGSQVNGRSIIDQLIEENVQMGWDNYIVPYGRDTISGIYPLNWAIRSALTFGGIKPGQAKNCLLYTKERVFAFGLVLGELDDIKYATGAGAINMGFPIIADTDIPQIKPSGITTYEALVKELDYKKLVSRCIEVRGVKVKVVSIPIPVPYAAAFEGERVRKEQLYVEFGQKASTSFEYLTTKSSEEVQDGKVELIGPDIDQLEKGNKSLPLAIIVEVYGRKMQKDFEPILERQIHRFINYAMGLMHIGQRDMNWIRISNDAFNKGLRLKHIGIILHAMLHQEYNAIVDKVQVKIYTKLTDAEKLLPKAKKAFDERDERIGGMTDESVDTYYSCLLCQSFAPNHVCIITPERLGLCGAYSWLDGKASYEIVPTGPNQPVLKGSMLDEKLGQWKNINEFVNQKSNKAIEKVSMYSLMDSPQSSCLVANTQVIIDDEPIKIGDFIDKYRGTDEYAKSTASTLNDNKVITDRIIAMQRFELPKERNRLVKIETKSGLEIVLTPDHKVAVDTPAGRKWIKASKVGKGDRLIAMRKLDIQEKPFDIYDLIPNDFRIREEKLIKGMKEKLTLKYGSLGKALKELSLDYFRNDSISISDLKLILQDLKEDWQLIKKSIDTFWINASKITIPKNIFNKELFYLMGLLTCDGSIFKRGNYEYNIYFINTEKDLKDRYVSIYKSIFPGSNLDTSYKKPRGGFINKRRINSRKNCFVCYSNNPLLGLILSHFGITPQQKCQRYFKNLLGLPKEYISAFLSGLFDGDGSVRLRKYKDKWPIAEAYLCTEGKDVTSYLQVLLKRFGIIGNITKSGSVYKIVMHGKNVYGFSEIINPIHPKKKKIISKIKSIYKNKKVDKSQVNVFPFSVGRSLICLPDSKSILSPTTYFYYKTNRSRPILANIQKLINMSKSKQAKKLIPLLDSDLYLDTVSDARFIKSNGVRYVYNLTLAKHHRYFANQILVKNCGCFECIVAIIPEANGVMIVNRDYPGMTPSGMTFTTLAGSVGGGVQTPGFLGVGKLYIVSKKFISAEGGLKRLVWMPKELKELLGDRLKKRVKDLGEADLIDKIADEAVATTQEELLSFLQKVNHPALEMPPIL